MPNAGRDTTPRDDAPDQSRWRNLAIVASMAVVSLAFGAGLLVNGGFGLGPSIIGGLGLFVLAMLLHTILRRLRDLSRSQRRARMAGEPATAAAEAYAVDDRELGYDSGPADFATTRDEDAGAHGWGEPAAVNDLVRQLATELRKAPDEPASAPSKALASPPSAGVKTPPVRPMPIPAPPLESTATQVAVERAAPRPAPPRAPMPPQATRRDDVAEIVRRAIEGQDMEIHLQPVMSLNDRRVHLYEAFPRLRDSRGGLVKPEAYARAAADLGLATDLERVAFQRMAQILARLIERGKQKPMFVPLSADALRDGTFLRAFHETLKAGPSFAANLVFELPESDVGRLGPAERDAIRALANAGFRFSLQDVVQLDMELIGDLPIAFVKLLPIALSGAPGSAAGLVARVRSMEAEPVVDGVQSDNDVAVARALGIVLGQGSLLSEPRPLKAEVIGTTRTGT
ncbi:MAG: EAL domain-containing protein [Hyphomicrobiaceae bacterium]